MMSQTLEKKEKKRKRQRKEEEKKYHDGLIPVNGNTAGSRGSNPDASVTFTFKPLKSAFVVFEIRF